MYRRSKKYQAQLAQQVREKADLEKAKIETTKPGKNKLEKKETNKQVTAQAELPQLRRIIEVTDFDSGQPITHRIELYSCDRIDCYNALVDGKKWLIRIGWSKVLAQLRMNLPRLKQVSKL